MPMYNLIDYSDNFSRTSGSLWQYYRDEPDLTDNSGIKIFMLVITTALHSNLNKK